MSINLTEAVGAAKDTRAYRAGAAFDVPADGVEQFTADVIRAAAPIIERQVREQVAVEIEAARDWRANNFVGVNSSAISDTYSESACIARGGAA